MNPIIGYVRYIPKMNLSTFMNNTTRQCFFKGIRTLYTDESIGMTNYKHVRSTFLSRYERGVDAFLTKMRNDVNDTNATIFTEDLKAVLHLVNKTPEEIQLLQDMLQKYNSQSNEIRFSSFKFGPIIMRTLHFLNEPDLAKKLYLNPEFESVFSPTTTSIILLDLLYENKKYQDVREVYDEMTKRYVIGITNSKLILDIVAMSCFKENTQESYEYIFQIAQRLQEQNSIYSRRFIGLCSALALNQKKPLDALNFLNQCTSVDILSIRSLIVMALADADRIDDVIEKVQTFINQNLILIRKVKYYPDVIKKIQDAIERLNIDKDSKICELLQAIKDAQLVFPITLEEHITKPILSVKRTETKELKYRDEKWNNDTNMISSV